MKKHLVSINDLPPGGKEFTVDDQDVWLEPLKEFKMDCRITKPLAARIFVMAADDGCLARGTLTGEVVVPCNRCAENASVRIDSKFDEYEEIPPEEDKGADGDAHIVYDRHAPMLNLAEVAWEQFMLAMPPQPLCRPDCAGLCPKCGANLNLGACACENDEEDPRMAPLRNLTVKR